MVPDEVEESIVSDRIVHALVEVVSREVMATMQEVMQKTVSVCAAECVRDFLASPENSNLRLMLADEELQAGLLGRVKRQDSLADEELQALHGLDDLPVRQTSSRSHHSSRRPPLDRVFPCWNRLYRAHASAENCTSAGSASAKVVTEAAPQPVHDLLVPEMTATPRGLPAAWVSQSNLLEERCQTSQSQAISQSAPGYQEAHCNSHRSTCIDGDIDVPLDDAALDSSELFDDEETTPDEWCNTDETTWGSRENTQGTTPYVCGAPPGERSKSATKTVVSLSPRVPAVCACPRLKRAWIQCPKGMATLPEPLPFSL